MKILNDFYDNQRLADSFFSLQKKIFPELDLKWAFQNELVSQQTIPWGIFHEKQALSILNATLMKIVLDGEVKNAVQIGTVATDPDYRFLGLSKKLLLTALGEYKHYCDFIFLFANDTVLEFYPKFGFKQYPQYLFRTKLRGQSTEFSYRRLQPNHVSEDLNILEKLYENRDLLSNSFSVIENSVLPLWYCRVVHKDYLWYDDRSQTLLVAKEIDSVLHVFDMVSKINNPLFFEKMSWPEISEAIFHFSPDRFNGIFIPELDNEDDAFFIQGSIMPGQNTKIPAMFHT